MRFIAPALESTAGITFGGATVDSAGRWQSSRREALDVSKVVV